MFAFCSVIELSLSDGSQVHQVATPTESNLILVIGARAGRGPTGFVRLYATDDGPCPGIARLCRAWAGSWQGYSGLL
jgi:hypothetical protein